MFLYMLCGQGSYALSSGESNIDEYGDYNHDGIEQIDDVAVTSPEDSHDPCDLWSSSYDYYTCNGMNNSGGDSGDPCDPYSCAYNQFLCGGDTGDPCDPGSSTYDLLACYGGYSEVPDDESNPCDFASMQAAIGATTFFANHALQLSNSFSPFSTTSGQNEEAFVIAEVNGVISSGIFDTNGGFTSGGIQTVGTNGGSIKISGQRCNGFYYL
jgi:hypothetical protein